MRVVNLDGNRELARFDLTESAPSDTAVIFGEILRDESGWKFRAIGRGSDGGLYKIAKGYGVNVAPG